MRWDDLFADLEGRLDAAEMQERADEIAERTRAERAGVALADRIRAHRGPVDLVLRDGHRVSGEIADAAPEWALLADGPREHLVPLTAVAVLGGLTDSAAADAGLVLSRLRLGHALRGVAQDRSLVRARVAGHELVGRVDAVGVDHLDLAEVAPDTLRPTGRRRAVAFVALDLVTRV
ncbi:hypothetical protein OEB99_07440 [Actinotalea sp. M2MS4P-6]|uniref:hypothetical protein n=1 Tax=Actinotalea sp. M2MS4P-6 TaxID=2983762 RepID=UPI0021E48506|nr:hypothetical protein [Actinotalea sp. M2MS4P-6]MCV2394135.1 hypothetical protein [Actinotalea sp. M2MS4P-6]